MPYFDPDKMTVGEQMRVARWLEANGCRHWVALEPVTLRGKTAEYTAISRKDDKSLDRNIRGLDIVNDGRKRLRIRVPLAEVE